ncbi:MAG: Holliday junction branch migration protein RuvA [Roseburia sp.]|nr:Holliday junction branch migration protein RuvA [Roseburia sp.]MCM1279717.1 Holliday junction branch migration protein RuvA [Robinsoniella sp.]
MIGYLCGEIAELAEDLVVLDVHDIGYNVRISSDFAARLPGVGERVKIFTYTYVKEDAFLLYGFPSKDELDLFKKMIGVGGIGPKGALGILSVLSAADLRLAIYSGDIKAISKAPGIGKKTAERLILDLRDKVSPAEALEGIGSVEDGISAADMRSMGMPDSRVKADAIEALVALGYTRSDTIKAVQKIAVTESTTTEEILKEALKHF